MGVALSDAGRTPAGAPRAQTEQPVSVASGRWGRGRAPAADLTGKVAAGPSSLKPSMPQSDELPVNVRSRKEATIDSKRW
jgi:hypothetical protein